MDIRGNIFRYFRFPPRVQPRVAGQNDKELPLWTKINTTTVAFGRIFNLGQFFYHRSNIRSEMLRKKHAKIIEFCKG